MTASGVSKTENPASHALASVALIEPVGSHGGMDYYDSGLAAGLAACGVPVVWFSCDVSEVRGSSSVRLEKTFVRPWGRGNVLLRAVRYVAGLWKSVSRSRALGLRIAHFHFFHVGVLEALGVLIARVRGLNIVVTIHDVESFRPSGGFALLERMTYRLANRLVVHNGVSRRELVVRQPMIEDKIRVVPHGSYLGLLRPLPPKDLCRKALGLPSDEPVLLFFGQIKKVKGLDLLIDAFADVRRKLGRGKLVIAGKVWKQNFQTYAEQLEKLGLGDSVQTHIRYISDDELPNFYGAADVVVLPYRKIYQSGVLLMAMSLGVPVVASDLPGMKEVVSDGRNGLLFASGDADDLARVLTGIVCDQTQQSAIKSAAMLDMENQFSWASIGWQLRRVYEEVLNGVLSSKDAETAHDR